MHSRAASLSPSYTTRRDTIGVSLNPAPGAENKAILARTGASQNKEGEAWSKVSLVVKRNYSAAVLHRARNTSAIFQNINSSLPGEVLRPRFHELPPLGQGITAPVSPFGRIANDVGQRRFGDLAREVGFFRSPIAK